MHARCLQGLALALSVMGIAPQAAFGHAAFVGASPQPGQRIERTPDSVTLRFTEALNPALTSVRLTEVASGDTLSTTLAVAGGSKVVVDTGELPRGAYRVEWRTVSTEDGHALAGMFSFGVRMAAAGEVLSVEQSPFADDGAARVIARFLLYTAGLLFTAAVLLPSLMRAGRSWLVPEGLGSSATVVQQRARERSVVDVLAWSSVAAAIAAAIADAGSAARSLSPGALSDYLLANAAGMARVGIVACFLVAALCWRRRPAVAAVFAVLALGAVAASGHASSASPRVPSILNDWLHLVSGAAWVGGIGLLALVWAVPLRRSGPELRRQVVREVLSPFGRVALPAFVTVSATGLVSLLTQLGQISALWQTAYGRVLAVKIGVVIALAAVSALHALRWRPRMLDGPGAGQATAERRHWRLVRGEPALGVGVVVLVAVLVAFPLPPRQLGEADQARAAVPQCAPCPLPGARADELPVATNAGSHVVAGWVRRNGSDVTATVRLIDIRGKPSRAPFRAPDAAVSACGTGCWRVTARSEDELRAEVMERGRWYRATLPTRWLAAESRQARSLLGKAERAMRNLTAVRQVEEVSSGPGSYARTVFRLRAPDRMALRTDRGVRRIVIGTRQWSRVSPQGWTAGQYGSGLAFRTRSGFSYEVHARSIRLLDKERRDGRLIAVLALFEQGTPVWLQLRVDVETGRVIEERMITRGHFMRTRHVGFDRPVTIVPPRTSE